VLQIFVFDAWNVPFGLTVTIFITLIILYTFKGGIKTIIWTDTLQTTFMLIAVGISIYLISKDLHFTFGSLITNVVNSDYSRMLDFDWHSKRFFVKQIISGMFISIAMTGLDQEMMQKNLSCKNIKEAQKNMFSFSTVLIFVNLMFLFLGAVLYLYASKHSLTLPERSDDLFPLVAIRYLGPVAGLVFIIGLISAAYPSADGALTSLTTSFSIDFLGLNKRTDIDDRKKQKIRYIVHISFALLLLLVIIIFRAINDRAVIEKLFTVAGYTYGPLLGLFAFGLFTRLAVKDKFVPFIAVLSPIICYFLSEYSVVLFNGYSMGFELLLINGAITFLGLWIFRRKN
jgi:solute:Na+ symporter, SSS family